MNKEQIESMSFLINGREINIKSGIVRYNNNETKMRPKESQVLQLLIDAGNKIVSRNQIIETVWKDNHYIGEAGLARTIADLRKTLSDNDSHEPVIKTAPRQGYYIVAAISHVDDSALESESHLSAEMELASSSLQQKKQFRGYDETDRFSSTQLRQTCLLENATFSPSKFFASISSTKNLSSKVKLSIPKIDHLNLAEILAIEFENEDCFIFYPYHSSVNLIEYCNTNQLSIPSRIKLFEQLLSSIEYAHRKGMLHGFIVADDLFVKERDGQPHLMVFGLGFFQFFKDMIEHGKDAIKSEVAEIEEISPELCNGTIDSVDLRTDVFSLGIVLYKIIFGLDTSGLRKHLYEAKSGSIRDVINDSIMEQFKAQAKSALELTANQRSCTLTELKESVSDDFINLLSRCIDTDAQNRFQSVNEMKAEVNRWHRSFSHGLRGALKFDFFQSIPSWLVNLILTSTVLLALVSTQRITEIEIGELPLEQFTGHFKYEPITNPWHLVQVVKIGDRLYWQNEANAKWELFIEDNQLMTGNDSPYGKNPLYVYTKCVQFNVFNICINKEVVSYEYLEENYTRYNSNKRW